MSTRNERRPLEAAAAREVLRQEPEQSNAARPHDDDELDALRDDLDAVLDGYEALLILWAYTVAATLDADAVAECVTLLRLHLPERAEIDARAVLADVWRSERARARARACDRVERQARRAA